jgi:hypothetical protein
MPRRFRRWLCRLWRHKPAKQTNGTLDDGRVSICRRCGQFYVVAP